MQKIQPIAWQRVVAWMAALLVLKVTGSIVANYGNYFPANFQSDFLVNRQPYFFGAYQWAFYPHIVAGPLSLVLGTILISEKFRLRFPMWHRYLGRFQVPCVLLVVAPSGLWMAYYAQAGAVAGLGFAILAVLTGAFAALGWRTAWKRRFIEHRRWMWRCYLLLCSAVVLRLVVGLGTVFGVDAVWFDPVVGWASWTVPLAIHELVTRIKRPRRQGIPQPAVTSQVSVTG